MGKFWKLEVLENDSWFGSKYMRYSVFKIVDFILWILVGYIKFIFW